MEQNDALWLMQWLLSGQVNVGEVVRALDPEKKKTKKPMVVLRKPYGGSTNQSVIDAFLEQLQLELDYHEIQEERDRVITFGRNVTGTVSNWFRNIVGTQYDKVTYDELIKKFKQRYYPVNATEDAVYEFETLRQQGTISKHIERFSMLVDSLPTQYNQDNILMNKFLSQVKPNVRRYLQISTPRTLQEMFRDAKRAEDTTERRTYTPRSHTESYDDPDQMEVDEIHTTSYTRRCFNCGKPGHIAVNCPGRNQRRGKDKA